MAPKTTESWRDEFVLSRELRASGNDTELTRLTREGTLVPVVRGAYRLASVLPASTDDDDRYLALLRATALVSESALVLSHLSAARVWDLPNPWKWPADVHAIQAPEGGGRSNRSVVRHGVPLTVEPMERDGLFVTDLARTVVDVLRTAHPTVGLAIADAALRGDDGAGRPPLAREDAVRILEAVTGGRGTRRARSLLAAADPRSESPGESISRWGMMAAGLTMPELQQEFRDPAGRMIVDFWWPQFNLIGEFDGRGKYVREELLNGRSAGETVIAEKQREDRLRALGPRVIRWGWQTADDPRLLAAFLRTHGVT
jgi:hypothetical protein